jgi:predicted phosphodiesterase
MAVTGNRDFLLRKQIPNEQKLTIHGSEVVLVHGHLDPKTYWMDKFQYIASGYDFERYRARLQKLYPEAKVIIFGHTHHPENLWKDGKLFFNPGAVSHGDYMDRQPYYGLLRFFKSGKIDSEILPLTGAHIHAKKWVEQR